MGLLKRFFSQTRKPEGALGKLMLGTNTALGAGIGTMFLSFGNAFMFGGLLLAMPGQEQFEAFERTHGKAKGE